MFSKLVPIEGPFYKQFTTQSHKLTRATFYKLPSARIRRDFSISLPSSAGVSTSSAPPKRSITTMNAVTYLASGSIAFSKHPKPEIVAPTDAIVKVRHTTICGTDLHILRGDVPTCEPGRILGHEGVGLVETIGASVTNFKPGDPVLISCISACGVCGPCRRGMTSHCATGGWILGNKIDGTQAEYVRVPHAATSLYALPPGLDAEAAVMLSDIFPTGLECGVLNGRVQLGGTVAIVGAGPVGLAAMIMAQFFSPSMIVLYDIDDERLHIGKKLGADHAVHTSKSHAEESVDLLTDGKGFDTVIEAVGVPQTFQLCQKLVAAGGTISNVGVHGTSALLHLEELWDRNISECFNGVHFQLRGLTGCLSFYGC
jgi:alcohol dehydrogenase